MPVSTPHPSYDAWFQKADKVRVAIEGEDAVKAREDDYLPKIGKTKADYQGYMKRAEFANFGRRTKNALLGTLFRKPVTVEIPEALDYLLDDASLDGVGLDLMIQDNADGVMDMGRDVVLVEFDERTQKPYIVRYSGSSMINWTTQRVFIESRQTNANILNMVVLQELCLEPSQNDPFVLDTITRYRVLQLEDVYGTGNLVYTQRVWVSDGTPAGFKHDGIEDVDLFIPEMRGKPMDYIPLVVFNTGHNLPTLQDSMLLDLVNINMKHYMKSADLNHGEHFTCLPTYYMKTQTAVGAATRAKNINQNSKTVDAGPYAEEQERKKKFVLGSSEMLTIPTGNELDVLEVTGSGLDRVANSMKDMEERMAALGSRLITQKVEQTATAEGIKSFGEQASLSGLANSLENGWQQVLIICAEWLGIATSEVGIEFNRNFISQAMTQQELSTLYENYINGAIDLDTYLYNLKKGEATPPEWDEAAHRKALEEQAAAKKEAADAAREALVNGVDQMEPQEPEAE